jgi:hypothetical protein
MILAAVIVVNISCTESPQLPAYKGNDYNKNLLGSWSRSFEEEPIHGDVQIYRPTESREFPPAMYRRRYVFNKDRTCEWLVLHPTDAHYMTSGTWIVDPHDRMVILVYDADGLVENVSFRVVELTAEIMRIRRISNSPLLQTAPSSGETE